MKRNTYFEVCSLFVTVILLSIPMSSCKRKTEDQEAVPISIEDIRIGYPVVATQEQRMEKFSQVIQQSTPVESANEVLKRMIEQIPLEYVAKQLNSMTQEPSTTEKPNIEILLERIREVQSLDEQSAYGSIGKLKADKNVDGLCVSLAGLRTEPMRASAAEALSFLGDPAATKVLTIQLLNVSGMHEGGSEGQVMREHFRRSLVHALAKCTGLDFSDYDASEAATLKVLKRCQDWLEETGRL